MLGPSRVGGDVKRYMDWKRLILALPPSWAKERGYSTRSFRYMRQVLRSGRIPRGHGAQTFRRACEDLTVEFGIRTPLR